MTTGIYIRKLNRYLALGGVLLAANIAMAQDGAKLIGHWSLDGDAADSAGANNGFLFGIGSDNPERPTFVSGKFGDALAFNGGVGVEVPIDLDYRTHQALTITMWVNLNGSKRGASAQTLVSTGTGSGPNISLSRDQLRATGGGKSVGPRRSLTADDWNFIAVSWDHQSGQLWMHVNNVEAHYPINYQNKRSQGMYFSPRDPDAELHGRKAQKRYLWLGSKDNSGKVYSLEGVSIDDVRIYDGILAAEELDQLSEGRTSGLVSDNFDPNRIPGDQLNPNLGLWTPGDQAVVVNHEEQYSVPDIGGGRDNIDPERRVMAGQTDALPGSGNLDGSNDGPTSPLSGGRELSPGAVDALQQARDENAPPDITYDSEEEGEAAAAAAASRREQELAGQEPPSNLVESDRISYAGDVLRMSGVSGDRGDYSERLVLTSDQQLLHWVETREKNDKPCKVYVHGGVVRAWQGRAELVGSQVQEVDVCDGGLPRINPLAGVLQKKPDAGEFSPMTAIQVCNNGMNKRVKGIRARTRGVSFPDAIQDSSYRTVVMQERTNCSNWEQWVSCPTNTFAIGATLFFRDGSGGLASRDLLSGIELVCSGVEWRTRWVYPKPGQ